MPEVIDMDHLEGTGPKRKLEDLSVFELDFRRRILGAIAIEARDKGDDRWHEAARQQHVVNAALVKKKRQLRDERGEAQPEPVNVGMQPVRLTAKRVRM